MTKSEYRDFMLYYEFLRQKIEEQSLSFTERMIKVRADMPKFNYEEDKDETG